MLGTKYGEKLAQNLIQEERMPLLEQKHQELSGCFESVKVPLGP